ncbi:hypothetical protein PDIG_82750 [Penicillium digitatum PHI26]|uniref:Uncharacterized protein n=2 Tax=Penicillium digitatum TaxID=36651 RepID=K9FWW1_PEND2|nr:hypothetical protein PDIP_86540 [Penicillium digitatum Pd1]EKV04566.1 hypothetical protein PDIP_86540 [Penicillium digitatum Pd1]EKV05531.1 hypothetical protein PDIG_82750 [Penicillium digitatum PHI26]
MNCEEVQKVGTALTILNPVENHHAAHLVLVPQSNIHLRDPRIWPINRNSVILAVVCLAFFSSAIVSLTGQLNLADQENLSNKMELEQSYANSAALAGMAAGPLLFAPMSHMLGRSPVIF